MKVLHISIHFIFLYILHYMCMIMPLHSLISLSKWPYLHKQLSKSYSVQSLSKSLCLSKRYQYHNQQNCRPLNVVSNPLANVVDNFRNSKPNTKERPITMPESNIDYYWNLNRVAFSLLPLSPGARRKTIIQEIVKDQIWTLDQVQGIVNVNVPVRATIVRLQDGGLFIYNPVAPTRECVRYVNELESKYGKVQIVVLGSLGLEHKSLAASFSQYFPEAQVYLQPGQWSFPLNLPDSFLGFPFGNRLFTIPTDKNLAPWSKDFDYEILGPLKFKSVGAFSETAFYHYKTQTMILTDTIVRIPNQPPDILKDDPRSLLFHARDSMLQIVKDTDDIRQKGWKRMVLFSLFFYPSEVIVNSFINTIGLLSKVSPKMKLLGRNAIPFDGGLYPWSWKSSGNRNFEAIQGKVFVAPILQKLILNREPKQVLDWANKISKQWFIKRIISSHYENNIMTTSNEFRKAFTCFEKNNQSVQPIPQDLWLLNFLSDLLTKLGVVAPPQPPL